LHAESAYTLLLFCDRSSVRANKNVFRCCFLVEAAHCFLAKGDGQRALALYDEAYRGAQRDLGHSSEFFPHLIEYATRKSTGQSDPETLLADLRLMNREALREGKSLKPSRVCAGVWRM